MTATPTYHQGGSAVTVLNTLCGEPMHEKKTVHALCVQHVRTQTSNNAAGTVRPKDSNYEFMMVSFAALRSRAQPAGAAHVPRAKHGHDDNH